MMKLETVRYHGAGIFYRVHTQVRHGHHSYTGLLGFDIVSKLLDQDLEVRDTRVGKDQVVREMSGNFLDGLGRCCVIHIV